MTGFVSSLKFWISEFKPGCEAEGNPGACHVDIVYPHENDVLGTHRAGSGGHSPALISARGTP